MKTIQISISVFAKIWSLRQSGENSEDEILARVLDCEAEKIISSAVSAEADSQIDFIDYPSGTRFPSGLEIFRTYRGKEFRAISKGGYLVMAGENYSSLSKLSFAVHPEKHENAWKNWDFLDETGSKRRVNALRLMQRQQRAS